MSYKPIGEINIFLLWIYIIFLKKKKKLDAK